MDVGSTVTLVTGSGKGIGLATARSLLAAGAHVAFHYYSSMSGVMDAVRDAQPKGVRAESFQADLRSPSDITRLVSDVEQTLGPIQILVNNAAVLDRTPYDEITDSAWDRIFDLNLRAVALMSCLTAKGMMKMGSGKIINIGDLAGTEPWPAYIAHAAAKAGVHHLTKCMALALAPTIQVNAVVPGLVDPPSGWSDQRVKRYRKRIPGGVSATPDDIAAAVLYLISNDAVTGQIVAVDRGQHLSL
jgi:NAD(P)-dependent dehydrogenase (short-subunit alcohol dehydrogenase family)